MSASTASPSSWWNMKPCVASGLSRRYTLPGTMMRTFNIKGIHVVARRMVLRNIQRLEIVIRRLDFRAFHYRVSDRKKNALQLRVGLPDQVAGAQQPFHAGQGKIDAIALQRRQFRPGFD